MAIKDIDIRTDIHSMHKNKKVLLVDELDLCQGRARIDLAFIGTTIEGYEIKSEADNLDRLPNQVTIYNKVLSKITLVVYKNHLEKALKIIPSFWGVIVVSKENETEPIKYECLRKPKKNPNRITKSMVQLLWKQECINILKEKNLYKNMSTKSRRYLWAVIANRIEKDELEKLMAKQIKARTDWRK